MRTHINKLLVITHFCGWLITILGVLYLSGCAVVDSKSNKDSTYTQKLNHVTVWSGISQINYFSGPIKPAVAFPDSFRQHLMASFEKHGIDATFVDQPKLPEFSAEQNNLLNRRTLEPSTYLIISIKTILGMRYAGFTHVDKVVFDISLIDRTTGNRVWRAETSIDSSLDVPKWNERTSEKFVNTIFSLLAKDGLIK